MIGAELNIQMSLEDRDAIDRMTAVLTDMGLYVDGKTEVGIYWITTNFENRDDAYAFSDSIRGQVISVDVKSWL